MNLWLIRLNGAPFLIVKGPSYIDPLAAARQYLKDGKPENPGVEVKDYDSELLPPLPSTA